MTIRDAQLSDAKALLDIYAPYVEDTAVTFEYDVPTEEEFRGRIAKVMKQYPWVVAEEDGRIAGYAYASPFKERAAYQWAVETSIYVDCHMKRQGIGLLLHDALEQRLNGSVTNWWPTSISVARSSADGTIWCGWKNS